MIILDNKTVEFILTKQVIIIKHQEKQKLRIFGQGDLPS